MRRLLLIAPLVLYVSCVHKTQEKPGTQTFSAPSWEQVAKTSAFSIRDTAEPVVFRDEMWLSNGYCDGGILVRDLWRSTDGVTWTLVTKSTPYDGYSEMVVYADKVWAVQKGVWNSTDYVNWNQVATKAPFDEVGYGEIVVFKDRMWKLGGKDVWYTKDGVNWECAIADAPYGPRSGSAIAVYKDKLWLMAGAVKQTNKPPESIYPFLTTYNDVWCSSDGAKWTRVLEHAPWAERMWVVTEVYAGKLWIMGGFSNRKRINFAEAWYTEDGVTWQEYKSDPMFSPRHEASHYVYKGSLWVVAGNSWPLVNDVWKLTLPEATGGAPKAE